MIIAMTMTMTCSLIPAALQEYNIIIMPLICLMMMVIEDGRERAVNCDSILYSMMIMMMRTRVQPVTAPVIPKATLISGSRTDVRSLTNDRITELTRTLS